MNHKHLSAEQRNVLLKLLQECEPVEVLRGVSSFVTHSVVDVNKADDLAGGILKQALIIQKSGEVDYK